MLKDITVVGQAIQITELNAPMIAIVNKGVVPQLEGFYTGSYFLLPYDPDLPARIVPGYVFEQNWKAWSDREPVNMVYFVDIVEV